MIPTLLLLLACTAPKVDDPATRDDSEPSLPIDADGDGWFSPDDCDDGDPAVYPGATEACNGVDDDCDGFVDEELTPPRWYADADGDGWGDASVFVDACVAPEGYVDDATDCDESDADIHPEATDLPGDGIDADCDGDYTCETLVTYEGDLYIYDDDAEAQAEAFCGGYNAISGGLEVGDTPLVDLVSLDCLCSVGPGQFLSIWIDGNDDLRSLRGLERLVTLPDTIYVNDCPSLETLSGLEGLRELPQGLFLEALPALTGVEALGGLRGTAGFGTSSVGLTSLSGLENLGGAPAITLWSNDVLTSLDGLAPRTEWGGFNVQGTPLEDLSALRGATQVGDLLLVDVEVTDLSDLSSLEQISGDFRLRALSLADLRGLDSLAAIEEEFVLQAGDALVSLDGLGGLQSAGTIQVVGAGLKSIEALENIERTGLLTLGPCESLTSVAGLGSLQSVDDYFAMGRLGVSNLDELAALRTVGGFLSVVDNPSLTSVSGLSSITSIGGDLYITDNPSLSTADAEALVDAIGRENIGGEVYISGNGP